MIGGRYACAMLLGLTAVLADGETAMAQQGPPPFPPCAGDHPEKMRGPSITDALLLERSVYIIGLANAGDEAALAEVVAPSAGFSVGSGDVSVSFGGGPSGLVKFFSFMRNPSAYATVRSKFGLYVADPCRRSTVTLLLRYSERGEEYPARWLEFTYENAMLLSISGYEAEVREGDTG